MKFTFIHIPRTGGNTVGVVLSGLFHKNKAGHRHPRMSELKDPKKPIITVVRNPFEWHVSWYSALHQFEDMGVGRIQKFCKEHSFEDYIHFLEDDKRSKQPRCYPRWRMSDWISQDVDHILRTESLYDGLRGLLAQYGIDRTLQDRHISKSRHEHYRDYYNETTRRIIEHRHYCDLVAFDYSF